jgi:enoyl-CoA hydratase
VTTVLYDTADAVATLTLNRPGAVERDHPGLIADLRAGLAAGLGRPDVRAIRLRGAGRGFCAGYDIGWGAR